MEVVLISPVPPFEPRDGHRLTMLSDVHAPLHHSRQVVAAQILNLIEGV